MTKTAMKTMHVIVTGRVQGVYFRDYTRRQAQALNLAGWVRNLPDGTVEALISGNEKQVQQMIDWFATGSPMSQVTGVDASEIEPAESFSQFAIRY